jgi:hypothetical protein
MVDLSKTRRKIEDIPSDNAKVVDTIAGALLRAFVRLNELDQANARSAAGSQCSRGYNVRRSRHTPRSNRSSPTAPNGGTGIDVFGTPVHLPKPRRPRGRPAGAKDSYQRMRRGNTGTPPELDPDFDLNLGHAAA